MEVAVDGREEGVGSRLPVAHFGTKPRREVVVVAQEVESERQREEDVQQTPSNRREHAQSLTHHLLEDAGVAQLASEHAECVDRATPELGDVEIRLEESCVLLDERSLERTELAETDDDEIRTEKQRRQRDHDHRQRGRRAARQVAFEPTVDGSNGVVDEQSEHEGSDEGIADEQHDRRDHDSNDPPAEARAVAERVEVHTGENGERGKTLLPARRTP